VNISRGLIKNLILLSLNWNRTAPQLLTKIKSPLIVIPAFNERESIESVVSQLRQLDFNVLVVDDGSADDTARLAKLSGAIVLRLPINLGVGGALRAGFRYAVDKGYSSVIQVDADGQHPAHQIHELRNHAEEHGAHLVIGSRYTSVDATLKPSRARQLVMRLLANIASQSAGRRITDSTSGFRIICEPLLSEFATEFPSYYLGDTFEAVVAAGRAGFTIGEIPAALSPRVHGQSSAHLGLALLMIAKVVLLTTLRLNYQVRITK